MENRPFDTAVRFHTQQLAQQASLPKQSSTTSQCTRAKRKPHIEVPRDQVDLISCSHIKKSPESTQI